MAIFSRTVLIAGAILLAHAIYSAQEYTAIAGAARRSSSSSSASSAASSASTDSSHAAPSTSSLPSYLQSTWSSTPLTSSSSSSDLGSLPLDIVLETLIGLALLCTGIVASSEPLRPVRWADWAAQVEARRRQALQGSEGLGPTGTVNNQIDDHSSNGQATTLKDREALMRGYEGFGWLDAGLRRGFLDIQAQRKGFADWVRHKTDASVTVGSQID